MSRLPGPDEHWIESTEGDLDPDLAEEYPLSDWEPMPNAWWWPSVMRVVLLLLIVALVVPAIVLTTR
jgi:hypothetical protein